MSSSRENASVRIRSLERHEIAGLWSIDRSERIEGLYVVRDGRLLLEPHLEEVRGWPAGERERTEPVHIDCFERGGIFRGAFAGEVLVGGSVLDRRLFGPQRDRLQLEFLYVDRGHRGRRIGRILFEEAAERARALGARALYVSATPTENTIRFYQRRGCRLARAVDPALFAREPEDIHLELDLAGSGAPPAPATCEG